MQDYTKDTSSKIKAIETEYKGYRFRSRLEARWAVFFETAGIKWQYEPEGFISNMYETPERYLPDFYLPTSKTWIEVKGTSEALKQEKSKLENMLDWQSPIPGIQDSYDDAFSSRGLLILGEIPEPIWGITLHPIIQHHKGLIWSWCAFEGRGLNIYHRQEFLSYFTKDPEEWSNSYFQIKTPLATQKTYDSYKAARSARFEHGENHV